MTEKQDFTKFKFGEKFERLPLGIRFDNTVVGLDLIRTKVDMVPAGLKGVKIVEFSEKPLYVSPDFEGEIIYPDEGYSLAGIGFMEEDEIKVAKERYIENRELVEKPRYVENEDGSLSLCSLPSNMNIILKPHVGYYLDLTRTDVIEKQEFKGFQEMILYPKRQKLIQLELGLTFPKKVVRHKKPQMVHSKPRIME